MSRISLVFIVFGILTIFVDATDRVRLADVQTLTFQEGRRTTGRRSSPIAQLKCVGGSAGLKGPQPKVVQCYNRGWDGRDVQWECKAETEKSVKLGRVEVACEGYEYPDDPYILAGSCGLEYELDWTDHSHRGQGSGWNFNESITKKSGGGLNFVMFGVILVMIYITYRWCCAGPAPGAVPPGPQSGFHHPPPTAPPPYDDQPPPYGWNTGPGNQGQSGAAPPYGGGCTGTGTGTRTQQSPFGGFWTGMGTGSLLGYLFGRQGQSTRYQMPPPPSSSNNWFTDSNWDGRTGGGSSGWGSGSSSSGSGSGTTHTTTSYGGTRRR